MMPLLRVTDITKSYEGLRVLDEVSFSLDDGMILCLLGPSGCGKTTLLRIIAGLEEPDSGSVTFDGRDMARIEPHRRSFGMMFQEYALFPHKDVSGNVSFGLAMQGLPKHAIKSRAAEMLDLVGLSGFGKRNVSELSGGERQRIALARTLAPRPKLCLLDEPLGSLDRALRERLMFELRSILKRIGMTSIVVTHDQSEAYAIADTIAVIMDGRIIQSDSPERLYRHPANEHVAKFLGMHNIVEGRVGPQGEVITEFGRIRLDTTNRKALDRIVLLIQPDAGVLMGTGAAQDGCSLLVSGVVKTRIFKGRVYTLEVELPSGRILVFDLPDDTGPLEIGQDIRLSVAGEGVLVIADEGPSA